MSSTSRWSHIRKRSIGALLGTAIVLWGATAQAERLQISFEPSEDSIQFRFDAATPIKPTGATVVGAGSIITVRLPGTTSEQFYWRGFGADETIARVLVRPKPGASIVLIRFKSRSGAQSIAKAAKWSIRDGGLVMRLPRTPAIAKEWLKPDHDASALVAAADPPAAEQPKPVAEQPKPVAEQPKPVAEQPKPVAEQPKPAAEQPKPAALPAPDEPPVAEQPDPPNAKTQFPVIAAPADPVVPKAEPAPTPVTKAPSQAPQAPSAPGEPTGLDPGTYQSLMLGAVGVMILMLGVIGVILVRRNSAVASAAPPEVPEMPADLFGGFQVAGALDLDDNGNQLLLLKTDDEHLLLTSGPTGHSFVGRLPLLDADQLDAIQPNKGTAQDKMLLVKQVAKALNTEVDVGDERHSVAPAPIAHDPQDLHEDGSGASLLSDAPPPPARPKRRGSAPRRVEHLSNQPTNTMDTRARTQSLIPQDSLAQTPPGIAEQITNPVQGRSPRPAPVQQHSYGTNIDQQRTEHGPLPNLAIRQPIQATAPRHRPATGPLPHSMQGSHPSTPPTGNVPPTRTRPPTGAVPRGARPSADTALRRERASVPPGARPIPRRPRPTMPPSADRPPRPGGPTRQRPPTGRVPRVPPADQSGHRRSDAVTRPGRAVSRPPSGRSDTVYEKTPAPVVDDAKLYTGPR